MKIKRELLEDVRRDKDGQKALALAIYLKHLLKGSRLPEMTLRKVIQLTRLDYRTVKRYLPLMESRAYIHFEGLGKRKTLVVNRLKSHRPKRNVDISSFDFSSYKEVLLSLRSFMVMRIQAAKDWMKVLLDGFHNPSSTENLKDLGRKVRSYVQSGVLNNPYDGYKEYGLSLKRIARELGCSVKAAEEVVDYAISHSWMAREHHCIQVCAPGINHYVPEGYTFSTTNNAYIVQANTYVLSPIITEAFFNSAVL